MELCGNSLAHVTAPPPPSPAATANSLRAAPGHEGDTAMRHMLPKAPARPWAVQRALQAALEAALELPALPPQPLL
jgi:hypothetical protein